MRKQLGILLLVLTVAIGLSGAVTASNYSTGSNNVQMHMTHSQMTQMMKSMHFTHNQMILMMQMMQIMQKMHLTKGQMMQMMQMCMKMMR